MDQFGLLRIKIMYVIIFYKGIAHVEINPLCVVLLILLIFSVNIVFPVDCKLLIICVLLGCVPVMN